MSDALGEQVGGNHYKHYKIQPVTFCQVNKIPFCESNIIKYACRWRAKGGIEDLQKIKHFVDLLIQIEFNEAQGLPLKPKPGSKDKQGQKH